ncbi:uncharacterized protein LOC127702511 isoform X2 [Mytilus californianus]|nr:uncharacterized protein LOC127702511 isoform X2 [Mytilus californianus]
MAEAEERKEEYYLRLLTFVIGPATEVLQLYFEIKVLNSLDFFIFLENHKHVLFHELYPSIPCCECKQLSLAAPRKKCRLTDTQFDTLFETDEGQEVQDHKRKHGHTIKQLCLCSVSAKRTTSVDLMDITLLASVVKSCCKPGSISGNPIWITDIKKTRNFIAHSPKNKITKSEFDQKFGLVEQSVLNIASVVGPVFLKMIKDQISIFKNSNLSTIIDKDLKRNINDSIYKILEIFVEEQKSTLESLAHQTRNLVENTEAIKTEVFSRLDEQKELTVGIRNVVFEVKTLWKDEISKATDPPKKGLSHDYDVCYVEWTLATPSNWDIDEIKETLENFSSLMGKFFRIVFVYKGSLVIQTSAQVRFLQSDEEFQLAVKSFLKDLLDICDLDTETKTIVQVGITISNEKFESKYFVSEKKMDTSWLTCDPCSSKNVVLEAIQFCSECQYKLCRQCISNHNTNAVFCKHHLTDIGTLSLENFCTNHEGSILDFFCVVHDCLCCLSCKIEEHNSCQNVLPLEDAAKDVKHSVMFQDVYNAVSNIRTTLNTAITSQDVNIENLNDDEATISSQLASYKTKMINRLDKLEGIIIHETSALNNEQCARIESHKTSLLQIKRPIKKMSRKIDQVSKYGSQKQLFILINKYKLEITALEIKLQNILPTLMTGRMIFQPQEDVQNTITSLASTRINTLQYKADFKPPKIQQVQVRSVVSQMPTKFTLDRKIEIKRPDDTIIRKIDITDDNRLLLCSNFHLLVYSDRGDYLQDCELSGKSWDIAVIPGEDKAVVTLPSLNSIQFIDIKTMKAGSSHSIPVACWDVTIVNDKICVGGYFSRENLYILDKQGKCIKKVNIPKACYITSLYPGPDESVYYTDSKAVGNVTLEGEQLFRYTSAYLKEPMALTTDKKGNLYVAYESSNTIQRITSNGKFLDIILNTENDIYRPTDIIFSNDYRKLFVLNCVDDNTYVLVFSCS